MIAPDPRIDRCGGSLLAYIRIQSIDDGLTVNGVADSLTQAGVLQILVGAVELQAVGADAVEGPDLDARSLLQRGDLRGGDGGHINLAGLQSDLTGVGVGNNQNVNGLGGHHAAEVIIEALQNHFIVLVPGGQLVGAGAVHGLGGQAQLRAVLLNVVGIQNQVGAVGQVRQHRGDGAGRHQLHGVIIDHVAGGDVAGSQAGVADGVLGVQQAVVACLDVLGGQFLAAVELHTMLQVEGPGAAVVGDFPALGQIANHLIVRVAANQLRIDSPQIDVAGVVHLAIHVVLVDAGGNGDGVLVFGAGCPGGCGCGVSCRGAGRNGVPTGSQGGDGQNRGGSKRKDFLNFHFFTSLWVFLF